MSLGRTTCYSCVNRMTVVPVSRSIHIDAHHITLFLCGFAKNKLELVLCLVTAKAFTSFGDWTKLPRVWSKSWMHPSQRWNAAAMENTAPANSALSLEGQSSQLYIRPPQNRSALERLSFYQQTDTWGSSAPAPQGKQAAWWKDGLRVSRRTPVLRRWRRGTRLPTRLSTAAKPAQHFAGHKSDDPTEQNTSRRKSPGWQAGRWSDFCAGEQAPAQPRGPGQGAPPIPFLPAGSDVPRDAAEGPGWGRGAGGRRSP